jgi:phosphoribosylformylglycinamidine (FGAM) synthase-like amidotransferase family enzyme
MERIGGMVKHGNDGGRLQDAGVKACVITGYGINADLELEDGFRDAGAETGRVHIRDLIDRPERLETYDILAFPGGFSFGDHLGSGKVFAHMFRKTLKDKLTRFVESGKLIIGICNGFQVLVKMGVLPNLGGGWEQEVSLIHNDSGVFEDSWVRVRFNQESPCIWTEGLSEIDLPIRHGEGRFVTASPEVREVLERRNLIAVRYADRNPNGSEGAVAGITDPTGRILGLMPHPEAYRISENHPDWRRNPAGPDTVFGVKILENGVNYVRKRAGIERLA